MTLKEILDCSDFKEVAKVLKQHYPEYITSITGFKESFDALRQLEPASNLDETNDKDITLEYKNANEFEKKFYNKDYYIIASCWGNSWDLDLAKEVIVSDELNLTNNEIAAHCLWELTYFGNQLDDSEESKKDAEFYFFGKIDDISNPYVLEAEKLKDKLYQNNKPRQYKHAISCTDSPELLKEKYKNKPKYFKYMPEEFFSNEDIPKNRIKRMRDKKIERRIKKLERMAKVEKAIRRLTTNTKSFTRDELKYLFDTKLIYEKDYRSWVENVDQRVNYLIDLISNYEFTNFSKFTNFLLMFRASSKYSLSQKEIDMLQNFFSKFLPASANIRYGYGTSDYLDMEVRLFLLCNY